MFKTIKYNKYYKLFHNLNTNKNNFITFKNKYDILIETFPYKKYNNYKYFIDFILNDIENIKLFKLILHNISSEKTDDFIISLYNNFNKLNDILINITNKKKIILGIIWNILGYYLSIVIINKLKIKKIIDFRELFNNNYYLFLTCCYIYYDDLLDNNENINKKIILKYTDFFFKNVNKFNTINEIINEFIKDKSTNTNIFNDVNRILDIFLKEYKKNKNEYILKCITELFNYELICSKKQKNNEDISECIFIKSYKSLLCIIQIILNDIDCNNTENIKDLIYFYGFISQLLDDLNDIHLDKEEGINTLFTDNNKLNNNIIKLLKLIYYDKEDNYLKFIINLLIFNYGIAKLDFNKKIDKIFLKYVPFSTDYLIIIRNIKNKNIKKINFNNINIKKIINIKNLYCYYFGILNNSIDRIIFRKLLKREIYLKKKYIKNLNIIYNNG